MAEVTGDEQAEVVRVTTAVLGEIRKILEQHDTGIKERGTVIYPSSITTVLRIATVVSPFVRGIEGILDDEAIRETEIPDGSPPAAS